MTTARDPDFTPRLRHCTFFVPDSGGPVIMIVGDSHFEIEQHGADLKSFLDFKRYLDGRHTVREISQITGVSVDDALGIVETAHPLIGTWSWINNLCQIAREDTLGYLACTKLFEARGVETLEGAHGLQAIATAYGYPDDCLSSLVSHVREDVQADHTGLLEQALADRDSVPAWQAHRAVNNLHDLKHSFDQYNDNIVMYYSDVSNYIPRLTVDYFSL